MIRYLLALLLFMSFSSLACAQILFSDDFQDGNTEGWQGNPGNGDIRLTRYKKNISMRLQHDAYAVTLIPTKAYDTINLSVEFAAENLRSKDYCILETSFGGDTWTEIGRVSDGQDDAISLHKVSGRAPKASGHKLLAVRLRVSAHKNIASCWADNLRVIGKAGKSAFAQKISLSVMKSGAPLAEPFSTNAFTRPDHAQSPRQNFQGSLKFSIPKVADGFIILKDDLGYEKATGKLKQLPAFSIDFVSDGSSLIPVQRGPQAGTHPDWEWIFGPGEIWSEVGDNGWSRASLPVALQERNANCIHNGLLSFAYKDSEITKAVVQIGSETCAYLQFDMWSKLDVERDVGGVVNTRTIMHNFREELRRRLPRTTINALAGTDVSQIGSTKEINPDNMTVYGFAVNGQLYASACQTRHGPYPYCASMALPSYSMAKSIVASIGLMRLEKLYPGASTAKISDFVPHCSAKNWGVVSFENALDMSTGNYTSKLYDKDEASPKTWTSFMSEETHIAKIKHACKVHKRKSKPGKTFVYHTTDTYILGTAMQDYLREQSGNPKADIYDDLLRPIWNALGLSPMMNKTRRTYDNAAQPFTGWGLTMHADDLVRIAQFLQVDGKIEGVSWLDNSLLKSALQQNPNDRGHKAINESLRYRAGFWAYNAGPFMGCKGDMWIPNMSGFGGLATVLMPNGHVYFYISDGHEYAWRNAAKASNEINPFCEMK